MLFHYAEVKLRLAKLRCPCFVLTVFLLNPPLFADGVIYQAFNTPFDEVKRQLIDLEQTGYEAVQVSPPIKTIDEEIWWGRYQPIDYRVIEGPLGNEHQLRELIAEAHRLGLKVIVDMILNHMADPVFHDLGLDFPEFSAWDFHYPDSRPCISDWHNREQVTTWWLCDPGIRERRLPDLDTSSPYVRQIHRNFLNRMLDLGFDGFRIDAAKHIEPEYFRDVIPDFRHRAYIYGEVIGETLAESELYLPYMDVTDFHMLRLLLSTFSANGDMRNLIFPESHHAVLPGHQSVVFARNHDTAMHPTFFNFGDYQDSVLANVYLLAKGIGKVLIYRDDHHQSVIRKAVSFNKLMKGRSTFVRDIAEVCIGEAQCDSRNLLLIERGGVGFVLLNKASSWMDVTAASMPGLRSGCYKEWQHDFSVQIEPDHSGKKWITRWGTPQRGGFEIGPRSALIFSKVAQEACR